MLDCGNCGLGFEPRHADGLYYSDDDHVCADCGATNTVDIEDSETPEAYVIGWQCRHGQDGDLSCEECEEIERVMERVAELEVEQRLTTLAHNLAIGSALCRSFGLGYFACPCDGVHDDDAWRPGCGRPVGGAP